MTLEVEYAFAFRGALKRIHWREASDVDAAVLRFAAGRALRLPSGRYALRATGDARGYEVIVRLNRELATVFALYFYAV
jgi:hypothetical protein